MGPIQSAIARLKPQRVHIYAQGWWGSPSHINIGYVSSDPAIVRRQVASCKAVFAPAKVSISVDWYGPSKLADAESYAQQLMRESEAQGTEFSIMIDRGAGDFNSTIAYIRKTYFPSSAYSKLGGKFIVWQFGVQGIDAAIFAHANPDILLLSQNSTSNSYAWPNGFAPDTPLRYLERYLQRKDAVMVPCLWRGFDDHKKSDPAQSVWSGPARLMDPGPGEVWLLWNALAAIIGASAQNFTELGIATINDYEERSRLEPYILREYAAILNAEADALLAVN